VYGETMQSLSIRSIAICSLLLAMNAFGQQGTDANKTKCAEPQIVTDSKYSPGQVWAYKTRGTENPSTITILRVESLPKVGVIIHIRIDGIKLKNCSGGTSPNVIQDAPFTEDAIDRSVVRLVKQDSQLPDFQAGYADWRAHCGGVYTITVAEMLKADEMTFNAGMNCSN